MTLDDLISKQASAGERYAAAVAEFRAAFVELAAIDAALDNGNSGHPEIVRSFGPLLPVNISLFAHPVFAPDVTVRLWPSEVHEKRDALVASFHQN
jgi:hypothetical protein